MFYVKSIRNYLIKELYFNYIFIKDTMNQKLLNEKFDYFFKSIESLAGLAEHKDVYAFAKISKNCLESYLQLEIQ